MRLKFFVIPPEGREAEEELNAFLASHRVLGVRSEWFQDAGQLGWAVAVTYVSGGQAGSASKGSRTARVDYREVLDPDDFAVFAELRNLRKEVAAKEGVPPYAVFTNEQLARMVQNRAQSASDLGKIDGVGEARVLKWGAAFLEALGKGRGAPATDEA